MPGVFEDPFGNSLEQLVDDYLRDGGCPCRFPRFRATVRRDTSRVCGNSFTTIEQERLVYLYEHVVPVNDKQSVDYGWEAKCARCGSEARQATNEFLPGTRIDYLTITKPRDVTELGAQVGPRVYRCSSWRSPTGSDAGMDVASKTFPELSNDQWLAWMAERAAS
jgi:hypothetical protein